MGSGNEKLGFLFYIYLQKALVLASEILRSSQKSQDTNQNELEWGQILLVDRPKGGKQPKENRPETKKGDGYQNNSAY